MGHRVPLLQTDARYLRRLAGWWPLRPGPPCPINTANHAAPWAQLRRFLSKVSLRPTTRIDPGPTISWQASASWQALTPLLIAAAQPSSQGPRPLPDSRRRSHGAASADQSGEQRRRTIEAGTRRAGRQQHRMVSLPSFKQLVLRPGVEIAGIVALQ